MLGRLYMLSEPHKRDHTAKLIVFTEFTIRRPQELQWRDGSLGSMSYYVRSTNMESPLKLLLCYGIDYRVTNSGETIMSLKKNYPTFKLLGICRIFTENSS